MAEQHGTDENARRSGRGSGGAGRPGVRRAVVLGGPAEGPGAVWDGRGPAGTSAERPAPDPEVQPKPSSSAKPLAESAPTLTSSAPSSASSSVEASSTASTGTAPAAPKPSATRDPASGPETGESAAPEAKRGGRAAAERRDSDSGEARAEASAAATTGTAVRAASGDGGTGRTEGGHGGNGPGKPMLAAAALVGVVLIGVPLLLIGGDDDERDRGRTTLAGEKAESVLQDPAERDVPPGAFVPASPSASPSPAKKGDGQEKKRDSQEKERERQAAVAPVGASPSEEDEPAGEREKAAGSGKEKAGGKAQTGTGTGDRTGSGAKAETKSKVAAGTGDSGIRNVLIKNVKTGMCVDVPGYGKGKSNGAVNQYPCNAGGGDNQMWNLERRYKGVSPKGTDLYQIRNVKDGLCLDLPGYGPPSATTKVSQFPCNGTTADNQLWWVDPRPDGSRWIRNFSGNGLCLDVSSEGGTRADSRLTLFHCSDGDDHRWRFTG